MWQSIMFKGKYRTQEMWQMWQTENQRCSVAIIIANTMKTIDRQYLAFLPFHFSMFFFSLRFLLFFSFPPSYELSYRKLFKILHILNGFALHNCLNLILLIYICYIFAVSVVYTYSPNQRFFHKLYIIKYNVIVYDWPFWLAYLQSGFALAV